MGSPQSGNAGSGTKAMETTTCPRCRAECSKAARFCSQCGMALVHATGSRDPGRIPHPQPVPAPARFHPCADATGIFYCWESAWGGRPLVGTETLHLTLFNGGYGLCLAEFMVTGINQAGREIPVGRYFVEDLPRGRVTELEIPSYDIREPLKEVRVALVRAEFAPEAPR